jgi:putative FmdB family regulatory protein
VPTYEYRCGGCGSARDAYRTVEQRNDAPVCCGQGMERQISRVMGFVQADIRYDSPIDGRPITNKQMRLEDLARSNCQPYDPEMKKDAERRRKEAEAKLEKAVDETVEREIHAMTPRKRESLIGELEGGLTAEPMRHTANAKPMRVELGTGTG